MAVQVEHKVSPDVENTSSLYLVSQDMEQVPWNEIAYNDLARFQIRKLNLSCKLPEPVEVPVGIGSSQTEAERIPLGWHSDEKLIEYARHVNDFYLSIGLTRAEEQNAFDRYCDEYFKDGISFKREESDHLGTDYLA